MYHVYTSCIRFLISYCYYYKTTYVYTVDPQLPGQQWPKIHTESVQISELVLVSKMKGKFLNKMLIKGLMIAVIHYISYIDDSLKDFILFSNLLL